MHPLLSLPVLPIILTYPSHSPVSLPPLTHLLVHAGFLHMAHTQELVRVGFRQSFCCSGNTGIGSCAVTKYLYDTLLTAPRAALSPTLTTLYSFFMASAHSTPLHVLALQHILTMALPFPMNVIIAFNVHLLFLALTTQYCTASH